jgi:hypothetical protein
MEDGRWTMKDYLKAHGRWRMKEDEGWGQGLR